jgi:hypothetical protein
MTTELATAGPLTANIEKVLLEGDLKPLTAQERLHYYNAICASLGLNPLTKPFAYIALNGKLQLYALKDCTEQLRKVHGVSITGVDPKQIGDLVVVVASASDRDGRVDSSTGAVNVKGLTGEALANAMMKCETKAKRRVTLSLCGLGMLDETEIATLKGQGIASEPSDANNWPDPQIHAPAAADPNAEPEIRPRSQKGDATTPAQAQQAQDATPAPQREAVQGEVVNEPCISPAQAKRYFAIMRSAGGNDEQSAAQLAALGYHGHRDSIPKRIYEAAIDALDPEMKFHTNKPKE